MAGRRGGRGEKRGGGGGGRRGEGGGRERGGGGVGGGRMRGGARGRERTSPQTRVGYAAARSGRNFRSALAARAKSLSVRPLILCDQISILHLPQAT